MKILLVDDHPLIREAMRHVLAELADEVDLLGAGDAISALALLDQHPDLDLVLLDLSLPGPSGMAALDMIREHHPAMPVVVLSASDDTATVLNTLDRGAMGFIPKCSTNQVITNAIRLVLSGGVYVPPQAVAGGMTNTAPRPQATSLADLTLTERQTEVLALMVQGLPNKMICRQMNLAEGTVKIHVTAILKALNVSNRTQAVITAGRLGFKLPAR
ncbi:MAG: response regulator transcription factor [Rhodocyclaceae bacterium]|nr:response regulator transcription factor [Rhodocyclaceae bacterium]